MKLFGNRVLFVGAHPDDIELGAGALIHHILPSSDLLCLTLSNNQKNPLLKNIVTELYDSMSVLGVPPDRILVESFTTREFPSARQEILEYLLKIRREYKPDLVFVHSKADIHQDHNVTTDETLRAFRGTSVLGFDVVRSSYGFFPHCFIEVNEEDVEKKVKALGKYSTYSDKYYFEPALLRATMIRHGALSEKPYAEGFDILRIVSEYGNLPD